MAGTGVTVLCLMTRHLPRRSHVFANGVLESAIGVGYMVGPAFGGWLFELFRWSEVPLIVNATATALLIPLVANMRLEDEEEDDEECEGAGGNTADQEGGEDKRGTVGMTMRLFARPRFFAAVLVLLAVSISFGVFPSTLPPHLQRTLKIGEGSVGTVYAGIAGLYAFFTPFVGPLAENGGITNPLGAMAVCGALLMAVAHLCFGPSPLLPMRFDGPRDWRLVGRGYHRRRRLLWYWERLWLRSSPASDAGGSGGHGPEVYGNDGGAVERGVLLWGVSRTALWGADRLVSRIPVGEHCV